MQLLRQSTAATVLVGPVMDSSGTAYTSAVIGDFNVTKDGTSAALAAAATATHSHNGHYLILFTAGNVDTPGRLAVTVNNATYGMPPARFQVLSGATYDAIVTNAAGTSGGLPYADASNGVRLSVGTGTGQASLTDGVASATLVSTGLDAIPVTAPAGVAGTFPQMVVQTWRRFFKKTAKDAGTLTVKTYADDGTTAITTQSYADDGAGTESLGAAS